MGSEQIFQVPTVAGMSSTVSTSEGDSEGASESEFSSESEVIGCSLGSSRDGTGSTQCYILERKK